MFWTNICICKRYVAINIRKANSQARFTLEEMYSFNKEISKYDIFIPSYYVFDYPESFDPVLIILNEN